MAKKLGWEICAKCGELSRIQKHHVIPQSYFKRMYGVDANNQRNKIYLKLCQECHNKLHKILDRHRFVNEQTFFKLAFKFVMED